MKESRMQLLQMIYDHDQDVGGPLQISCDDTSFDQAELRTDVSALQRQGYITSVPPLYLRQYSLALTEKGEQFVENGFRKPSSSSSMGTFNFAGATIHNATIGNQNTVGSMAYNASNFALEELKAAISRHSAEEQVLLNEMFDILREMKDSQQPVEKGRLTRFYELVKGASDLVLPISQFLFETFFAPR